MSRWRQSTTGTAWLIFMVVVGITLADSVLAGGGEVKRHQKISNEDGNFEEQFKLLESFGIAKEDIMRRVHNYGGYKILKHLEKSGGA